MPIMGWWHHWTDAANRNVTVNRERYRDMISNFLLPKKQELEWHDMWYQQDGATCHSERVTMDLLREELGEHFISSLTSRSCD